MEKRSPWLTIQHSIRLLGQDQSASASFQPQLSSTSTIQPTLPVKSSRLRSLALWNSANATIAKRSALAGDEHSKPEIEGWLYKRSDKYRTWNKRWFILKGSSLFYLKSPKVMLYNDSFIHLYSLCIFCRIWQ